MKIKTDYWPKPIPIRQFDWSAVDDDTYGGPGSPIGFGRTEEEAIAELKAIIAWQATDEDDSDRYAHEMEEQERQRDAKEGFDA